MINVTKTTLPPFPKYIKYLKKIWKNNWVTNHGEFSLELQEKLENHLRLKHLLVVSNGTLAMQIAFKALELKGEVITTPFTFPATINALLWEGLTPVFADIDPYSFNIDPKEVEKKITRKTSAILAVHVFGNPCEVDVLEKIAKKHNLKVIYDAAHAFGIEYKGKSLLQYGDISTLSFHAAKIFHTIEGGAIITKKKKLSKKMFLLANHGIANYEKIVLPGTNAKMNEFQAAMGLSLLETHTTRTNKRKKIYEKYALEFSHHPKVITQKIHRNLTKHVYPYFPISFSTEKIKENVYKSLLANGIKARKYFYPPGHEFPYTKTSGTDLVNATKLSHTILCLPIYPTLALKDVKKICQIVLNVIN